MSEPILHESERVEITVLVDNYVDTFLIESTKVMKRPKAFPDIGPLAEHGLSCLIKVFAGSEKHVVLMDAGRSALCLMHNIKVFDVDTKAIEGVVLSHGHRDHYGGLLDVLREVKKGIPLVLHPNAFFPRRMNPPNGETRNMPLLDENTLRETGVEIRREIDPSTLASNLIGVMGEVDRVTDFEKGHPWAEAQINEKWIVDPFLDDRGFFINVKGKGLVVIGGCSHTGIINTVKYAQKISDTEQVHAVLGGFHLTGPIFEPIIGKTIMEMKKFNPAFVIPMHCTGWKAINQFAAEMPEQFLLNSVGTTYVF
ncbi:MAG: MBL fold metallo-hydrolase [Deltaproteobacteria bacterium]|nr:MBL fold metallo-hydrolase [Deltaproteobacteria bacterium]